MDAPPDILFDAVKKETAGSKLLWCARPDPWLYARHRLKSVWIGIPFTAFSIFWTWGASGGLSKDGKSAPAFFLLWGCMFILIGLSQLLSPLFGYWKAGRIFYVVTEKAATIFEKMWMLKTHCFDASGFGGFERISRGERGGDIVFRRNIERRGKGTSLTEVGFLGLRDFSEAEAALRRMIELNRQAA